MTTKAVRLREARGAARSVVSIRAREGGTRRAARGDTFSKRDTKKCVVTTFWAHERKHPRGGKRLFAGISHLGLVRTGFHARQSSFARSRGLARGRVGRFGARGNSDNNAVSESATRGLSTRQESRENSLHEIEYKRSGTFLAFHLSRLEFDRRRSDRLPSTLR